MSSRSIYNDHFITFFFEIFYTIISNLDRISFSVTSIKRHLDFSTILFQLIKSTSSESICTYQSYSPSLLFIMISIFSTSGSLTTSLKSYEHYDILFPPFRLESFLSTIQQTSQLLNHQLLN